jgi:hypothetical protein
MLLEEISERLVSNILKAATAFAGYRCYRGPSLVIELYALADHVGEA